MSIGYNDLSDLQLQAFDKATQTDKLATRIVGYAGTGKTTVLAEVAKHYGGKCSVLAPTNKAASVLKEKGINKARTIHSCLYQPEKGKVFKKGRDGKTIYEKNTKTGMMEPKVIGTELTFAMNQGDSSQNDLPPVALVDEASMADEDVYKDLLYAFEKVIFFGDGFQLPPVGRKKGALELGPADIEMKEVHRVALDNPIIRYATLIRDGNEPNIADMDFEEIRTCTARHSRLYETIAKKDVQSICYTNKMRHHINEQVRIAKGFDPHTLKACEPIICLQNVRVTDGDPFSDSKQRRLVMYNGQMVLQDQDFIDGHDNWASQVINIPELSDLPKNVQIRTWPFWNKDWFDIRASDMWEEEISIRKAAEGVFRFGSEFDYAYCLTAHKAQGSEYDMVAVFDERPRLGKVSALDKQRWFYTAVTRAKKKVLVVSGA